MLQRVAAALGDGDAPMRNRITGTPDARAARLRRRLAVRSISLDSPHGSIITAPKAAQRARAAPERSVAAISGARTRIT